MGRHKGYKHSVETIEKFKGKNGTHIRTEETKEKMRKKMIGRDVSGWIWKTHKKIKDGIKNGSIKYDCGEKSRNWRGGANIKSSRDRGSKKYKDMRLRVFKRDNYTCQKCGSVGGKIEAHHIRSFSEYPELRFTMLNVITLCKSCHKKTASYGGHKVKLKLN